MAPATAARRAETPTNPPGLALTRAAPVCEESPVGEAPTADAGIGNAMVNVVVKILPEPSVSEPLPELPESEPEPEFEPDELPELEAVDSLPLADAGDDEDEEALLPDDELPPEADEAPDADVEVAVPLPDPLALLLPLPPPEPEDVLVVNDVLVTTEFPPPLLLPFGSEGWSDCRTMNLRVETHQSISSVRTSSESECNALRSRAGALGRGGWQQREKGREDE